MYSGFDKGEVLLVDSSEENAKFHSIRTKVRQKGYKVVQQKWSEGPVKMKITYKYIE